MKELSIHELENVSGGINLGGMSASMAAVNGLTGIGSYAIGAGGLDNMTWKGTAASFVGGVAGGYLGKGAQWIAQALKASKEGAEATGVVIGGLGGAFIGKKAGDSIAK